jgi:mRNA-degrading endonuclease toxin of MazEF toxin-antitoxin module
VALVPQITALDRAALTERVARLSRNRTEAILLGVDLVLGR